MPDIHFDITTCRECGLCVNICPNKILQFDESKAVHANPLRVEACFKCGQCMAICPTKSVKVDGLDYDKDFFALPKTNIDPDHFYNLIATRRAVRNFQDKEVDAEILKKVVNAISFSPPGFPPLKYELIVINNRALMKESLPLMIELYEFLLEAISNPIKRQFVKKEVGEKRFLTMQKHLVPLMKMRLPGLKDGTENTITRDAPAMILFLSGKDEEDISEDIHIAATYGMLSAHSLGLGASIMDIIPPAINKKKELRTLFGLRDDQDVVASLILGYPKYRFQRGISRSIKNVTWLS